ncbi:AraC-type DNA-binding protein [Dyadobacter koreensis]|uniref:AraC-type DNA-binding protein n=1 Tax=Dyadobacter koreensis TaxID=408657 RepID=A0A1H6QB38_9BACT|nr:AraC family transcriptional regulator [Dyadobacter koreensis]SEI40963.1 AraC-type DNA-binding protein [Dyadobacter koreensis]
MIREKLHLFELAASHYGLIISPMLASYVPLDNVPTAFDLHRNDSYGIFLLKSGEVKMLVEGYEAVMEGSSLLLVQPGQVHQCVESINVSGWVMFVDAKNIDTKVRAITEQSVEAIALFELNSDELLFTDQLLNAIYQASEDRTPGPFQMQMLHALINGLFYQAAHMHLKRESTTESTDTRPAQIVQEFKSLIKVHFKNLKRPAAYAGLLHLSVSHLNDTIKSRTGYSATYLLQQEIIGDAQKQLIYSAKTVKEIAYNLGYVDYKYFIRLFTKIVGQSPSVFRNTRKSILGNK